jgi:hypothetical protein
MSLAAARNAVQLAKLATGIADMDGQNVRCIRLYVQPVDRKPQYHSSLLVIGLFTAGIAIDLNLAVTAGKQQLPGR